MVWVRDYHIFLLLSHTFHDLRDWYSEIKLIFYLVFLSPKISTCSQPFHIFHEETVLLSLFQHNNLALPMAPIVRSRHHFLCILQCTNEIKTGDYVERYDTRYSCSLQQEQELERTISKQTRSEWYAIISHPWILYTTSCPQLVTHRRKRCQWV